MDQDGLGAYRRASTGPEGGEDQGRRAPAIIVGAQLIDGVRRRAQFNSKAEQKPTNQKNQPTAPLCRGVWWR